MSQINTLLGCPLSKADRDPTKLLDFLFNLQSLGLKSTTITGLWQTVRVWPRAFTIIKLFSGLTRDDFLISGNIPKKYQFFWRPPKVINRRFQDFATYCLILVQVASTVRTKTKTKTKTRDKRAYLKHLFGPILGLLLMWCCIHWCVNDEGGCVINVKWELRL